MTFRDYGLRWLRQQRARLKRRTSETYEQVFLDHLCPTLGPHPVASITRTQVRDLLLAKIDTGYAAGSVQLMLAVLRSILTTARLDEDPPLLTHNPCERIGRVLPKRRPAHQQPAIDRSAVPRLVDEAKAINPSIAVLILLGFRAGLRIGELLALRWDDMDLEGRRLTVARSDWRHDDSSPKGGQVYSLPISQDACLELEILRDGTNDAHGWVFQNSHSGCPWSRNYIRTVFREALHRAGLPPASIHATRHSFASHLANLGESPWTIRDLLRHASVTTTEQYVHTDRRHLAVVDRLRG